VGFFLVSLFLARWALKPTEESWKRQQQFVADASHELKTPLTVLLADADILLAHPQDTIESQRKWVEYIQDEAHRMKELVEDMLFLARGDAAAKTQLEALPVGLSDLCWNCLLSFEPVAFEQGVDLASDVAPGVTVSGDGGQLRRLVAILLDNACKYCPHGGKVTLTLAKNGDRAALTVHNTGPAIPAEALPHLFERFYRVDAARGRSTGGYGLGLSIAASIAQRHRGKISVTSSEEAGTAFTVTLPAEHSV
jgi:signal transduction histidine kinase